MSGFKKILDNASIKNRILREREDLSALEKTFVHRYHFDSDVVFNEWLTLLTHAEKLFLKEKYEVDFILKLIKT